jgi:heptose-I-phosphate ethanolaminephosphotransferase
MTLFLLSRLAAFLLAPAVYLALDWLNGIQAAQSAVLGAFAVLAVSAWSASHREGWRAGVWPALLVGMPFFFTLSLQAFLRASFGVAQDDEMVIEALFNTDRGEAGEFLLQNGRAIGSHLAVLAGLVLAYAVALRLGSALLRRQTPSRAPRADRRRIRAAAGFAAVLLLLHLNPTLRKDDPLLFFPLRYASWQRNLEETTQLLAQLEKTKKDPLLDSVRFTGDGPRTVVLVVGESTARADLSLYGYPRRTTPELASLGDELLRFDDVVTCYPGTVGAIRLMLTPADLARPDLWTTAPDILTIAKKAGYKTFWLSNHNPRGVVSVFASHADVTDFTNRGGSRNEGSFDEVLLPPLQSALADPAPLKFVVMHMLGGHPAARFRYPVGFARFDGTDDDVARRLRGEGRAFWAVAQRNQYDNAMLYADHLLATTIGLCRALPVARVSWLFVPDHGEDVAHHTDFVGHDRRAREMWEIPLLYWEKGAPALAGTLRREAVSRPFQTDQLDHTLLALLGIADGYYDPRRDLLSPDFEPLTRSMPGLQAP